MTACTVVSVSGPAASDGHVAFDSSAITPDNPKGEVFVHGSGRVVTPCVCPAFLGDGGDCRRAGCGHPRHAHLKELR